MSKRKTHLFLRRFLCVGAIGFLSAGNSIALDNPRSPARQPRWGASDLAKTPPMGWNSWNKFACDVNETLIKEIADAMVRSGMKAAGYQYIVIDDCWQISRDNDGNIIADPKRFPSGMKALSDYIHAKGLKFGL